MNKILWSPNAEQQTHTNLTHYMHWLSENNITDTTNYPDLYRWSIHQKEDFWLSIWRYFNVLGNRDKNQPIVDSDDIQHCRWFPGTQLNFAENLLRNESDKTAIIACDETGRKRDISYNTLRKTVAQIAQSLKQAGVEKGDVVAGLLPNCSEAVIAMLATTSLGAVWTSCSPDFGLQGIIDRFGQSKPKVIFTTNGYYYAGKTIHLHNTVQQLKSKLSENTHYVIVDFLDEQNSQLPFAEATLWSDYLANEGRELTFTAMNFDDPLYIMYSSGTTGIPKCIVHGIGGTLLQHLKELALHTDLKPDDTIFYYSTCGWMMWNWLISSLALGATIVLYDGSPFYPNADALMSLTENCGISIFGAGAKYYSALEKSGDIPNSRHSFNRLRTCLSTGSPLAHESFDFIYRDIKNDICLSSISGGTDIISCFALGNPLLPVYRGELQCIGLGMDVQVLDDQGQSLATGKGQLACCSVFPSRPIGFLNDPEGEKYHKAYFNQFPNTWVHGDYAEFIPHTANESNETLPGMIIHGRSDATLNPGGVRIGTAEIYRQVEKIPEVIESIAVSQDWKNDVRIILFVKLADDVRLDDILVNKIKQLIRQHTTARHVPAKILQVTDIPRTISGKLTELAVRQVIHGETVKNIDALANPEALKYFKQRRELDFD